LRILLAAWAPFYAGAEVAAERLAVGLQEIGHEVTVLLGAKGETLTRMTSLGLAVRHLPLTLTDKRSWWRFSRVQRQLRSLLQEIEPDVVHANDLPTSQMMGPAPRRLGIPRICHHRWTFAGSAVDWLNKFGAEQHLYVSKALMDELHGASARLSASRGRVVHDGLPIPKLPSPFDRAEARRRLELPADKAIVLFAGQIIERKGVADLLHAWAIVANRHPQQAALALVGDDLENGGRHRRDMERLAHDLRIEVRFSGFQRNIGEWLTAADMGVVPSHVEPLGNATLEAMAYGLPVVASRVGGIPEMIVDGDCGLLVPPRRPQELAAAISQLVADCGLRHRLGLAARDRCERMFSLSAHVDAVLGAYESVTSRPLASSEAR
jgi:glycosyltransferase involved in cell wall biosynthesis